MNNCCSLDFKCGNLFFPWTLTLQNFLLDVWFSRWISRWNLQQFPPQCLVNTKYWQIFLLLHGFLVILFLLYCLKGLVLGSSLIWIQSRNFLNTIRIPISAHSMTSHATKRACIRGTTIINLVAFPFYSINKQGVLCYTSLIFYYACWIFYLVLQVFVQFWMTKPSLGFPSLSFYKHMLRVMVRCPLCFILSL